MVAGRGSTIWSVLQDTIQSLHNLQGSDDCSSLVLRLDYLNRSIVNNVELPDSFVRGLGLAIDCLTEIECEMDVRSNNRNASKIYSGRQGRPSFDRKEEQLSCVVETGELLEVSTRTIGRKLSRFGIRISGKKKADFYVSYRS